MKEIAQSLFVNAKTVEAHREQIKQKLKFKIRAELLEQCSLYTCSWSVYG